MICRGIRPHCNQTDAGGPVCADCAFLHEQQLETVEDVEFLRRCRAIREYVDHGVVPFFLPYVAAVLVGANGRILDIDQRSVDYLRSSRVLGIRNNRLYARESEAQEHLALTIGRVSGASKADTIVCSAGRESATRYAILLQPKHDRLATAANGDAPVACFVFPLGRRRFASVRQLISSFGLTPAEARLARALCHGQTLEEYAGSLSIKLSTVKTQLRAVFDKTQTDRQVALVNLIAGIPPLR